VRVLVIPDLAFHRRFWADDRAYSSALEGLEHAFAPSITEGVRHFNAGYRSEGGMGRPIAKS
jgi:hypothetical protein